MPTVYGFSSLVVPQPPAWGLARKFTGYWTLPAPPGWLPPPNLVDFIAAGPSPVCIGFESMSSRDPDSLTDLVIGAVHSAGVRAVLLSGWGAEPIMPTTTSLWQKKHPTTGCTPR